MELTNTPSQKAPTRHRLLGPRPMEVSHKSRESFVRAWSWPRAAATEAAPSLPQSVAVQLAGSFKRWGAMHFWTSFTHFQTTALSTHLEFSCLQQAQASPNTSPELLASNFRRPSRKKKKKNCSRKALQTVAGEPPANTSKHHGRGGDTLEYAADPSTPPGPRAQIVSIQVQLQGLHLDEVAKATRQGCCAFVTSQAAGRTQHASALSHLLLQVALSSTTNKKASTVGRPCFRGIAFLSLRGQEVHYPTGSASHQNLHARTHLLLQSSLLDVL